MTKPLYFNRGFVLSDAFGNALGNSVVAGLSSTATPQQAERKAKAAAHKAVLSGASPQQALMLEKQTYAQELGGTVNPVSAADSDETIDTGRRTTSVDGNAGFWLSDGNDRAFIDYNSSFDAISGFLGNSAARDLGVKFAAQTIQGYQKSQQAFADGYDRGFVSSVRSGVRAQQQQQLQTARQLDAQSLQKWQADQARAKMTTMEKVQLGLDVAGMTEIPVVSQIAELGSAGISLYNGDYVGAGLGVVSMIPIAGKWAEVAKMDRLTEHVNASNGAIDLNRLDNLSPGFYTANPSDLRFTQSDASPFFSDGRRVDTLIDDLRAGRVTPDQVGNPLQVVNLDGKLFSIDNRRLVAFSQSGITDVPIEIVSLKNPAVSQRFWDRFDPIDGEGLSITIATTKQREETQQLLQSLGKIRGVQLGQ